MGEKNRSVITKTTTKSSRKSKGISDYQFELLKTKLLIARYK
jgi:hypothetical protein